MIAFVGYTTPDGGAQFGLTHCSVGSAAVALARQNDDLLAAVVMMLGPADTRPFRLDERRVPLLSTRACLAVMADLPRARLAFFACDDGPVGWTRIGDLERGFTLTDVESIESWLHMAMSIRPLRAVG